MSDDKYPAHTYFTEAMLEQLKLNADKDEIGWENDDPADLILQLERNLLAMKLALQGKDYDQAITRAVNVGNFAMMVWDVIRE